MKLANFIVSAIVTITLIAPAGVGFAQSSIDVGAEGTGLLPSNPFYFLKEWGRGIRKFLTPSAVRKAELELNILSEKAAEMKKLEEITPENLGALIDAAANYRAAAEQLKLRLENLKETSQNPNVDRLLNQLTERSLRHQQLFEELQAKFPKEATLESELEYLQDSLADVLAGSSRLDSPKKFRARLEAAIERLEQIGDLEVTELVDRLSEKLSGEIRQEINSLRDDLLIKLSGRLQGMELITPASAPLLLEQLPGEPIRKLKILDEVREKVISQELKSNFNLIRQKILEQAAEEKRIDEAEARKAIESARQLVDELESKPHATAAIKELWERAKFNLEQAEGLFDQGNYGGAFGQATAASAAAQNALAQLTSDSIENVQTLEAIKSHYDRLTEKVRSAEITKEQSPKLFELLAQAEKKIVALTRNGITASALRELKLILATAEELLNRL